MVSRKKQCILIIMSNKVVQSVMINLRIYTFSSISRYVYNADCMGRYINRYRHVQKIDQGCPSI